MASSKFNVILEVETNLDEDELIHLFDNKMSTLVHDVYKADEKADVVCLSVKTDYIALTR